MTIRHVPGLAGKYYDDASFKLEPGDWEVTTDTPTGQRYFWFGCPGKCKTISALPIRPVMDANIKHDSWHLTGDDIDKPTLTPSVHHVGCWHGWIRDGEISTC